MAKVVPAGEWVSDAAIAMHPDGSFSFSPGGLNGSYSFTYLATGALGVTLAYEEQPEKELLMAVASVRVGRVTGARGGSTGFGGLRYGCAGLGVVGPLAFIPTASTREDGVASGCLDALWRSTEKRIECVSVELRVDGIENARGDLRGSRVERGSVELRAGELRAHAVI